MHDTAGTAGAGSELIRADDRLLLAQQGATMLPSPIALQLLDIPVVLPVQKQPRRVDGRLPDAFWRADLELVGADHARYRVRITGDPVIGLPYGRDADILLALFRILDEGRAQHDLASGTFHQPSFQLVCRALGLGATGPLVRRIRDALRRFSHVRVESRVLIDRGAEAGRLLAGDGAVPGAPTASTVRRHEVEESRWLLEYRTEERTVEERVSGDATGDATGDAAADAAADAADAGAADVAGAPEVRVERTLWIHELRINPFWVSQAISGWAGWIDVERHAALRSITARRLYQICAAQAARHVRLPWVLPEHELRAACLLSAEGRKPTRVRQMLGEAAEELVAAGVLARAEWQGAPRRGGMSLLLEPGPLLQLSGLLRGVGLTDPPDVRVQYALLRAFGVSAAKARAMLGEKPGQVNEVLLRACHLRATDPSAVHKSWPGWIIHHVDAETSFAGEVAFQEWRRTVLDRLDAPAAGLVAGPVAGVVPRRLRTGRASDDVVVGPGASRDVVPASEPAPAAPMRVVERVRPTADPAAADRWAAALDAVRPTLGVLDLYGVEDAVPVAVDSGALTVAVSDDIALRALQRLVPRIEAALRDGGDVDVQCRVMLDAAVAHGAVS